MPWRSRCALPAPRLHQQRGLRFLKFGTRERSWLGSARQKPNRAGRLPHLLWPLARLPSPRRRASRDQRRCICQLPPGTSLIQSAAVRAQLRGLPRPGSSMGSTRVLYCTQYSRTRGARTSPHRRICSPRPKKNEEEEEEDVIHRRHSGFLWRSAGDRRVRARKAKSERAVLIQATQSPRVCPPRPSGSLELAASGTITWHQQSRVTALSYIYIF